MNVCILSGENDVMRTDICAFVSAFSLLRPLFMGAESCEKSESFVATFGRKLWSKTLFLHARYGAMKVLCTGLVEFGGVLVENSKGTHS